MQRREGSSHVRRDVILDRSEFGVRQWQLPGGRPSFAGCEVAAAGRIGSVEDAIEAELSKTRGDQLGAGGGDVETNDGRDVKIEMSHARIVVRDRRDENTQRLIRGVVVTARSSQMRDLTGNVGSGRQDLVQENPGFIATVGVTDDRMCTTIAIRCSFAARKTRRSRSTCCGLWRSTSELPKCNLMPKWSWGSLAQRVSSASAYSFSGLKRQKPRSRSGKRANCWLVQSFSALTFSYSFSTGGRFGLPYI